MTRESIDLAPKTLEANRVLFSPVATGRGITPCKHWPAFDLYNYNFNSKSYLNSFGLEDMKEADVTIVGLYIADDKPSQNKAKRHADLKKTLDNMEISTRSVSKNGGKETKRSIRANVAAINYFSPLKCAEKKCVSSTTSTNDWFWEWFGWDAFDECYDTIGGCSTGYFGGNMDNDLLEVNWQAKLAVDLPPYMPLLQDLDYINVWDAFGGQDGDLFIYDATGRLYAYVCTNADICDHPLPGNTIAVQSGFDYVLELAKEAAKSNGNVRCKRYIEGKTDDLPSDYSWAGWSEDGLDAAKRSEGPEQDDDWVNGYSKSAAAAESMADTDRIGNTHPSDYDSTASKETSEEDKSGNGEYTGTPQGIAKDDVMTSTSGSSADAEAVKKEKKDYTSNKKRGIGPTWNHKGGTVKGNNKLPPPKHADNSGWYILVFLLVFFMLYRYRRYKKMQEDAANSYSSLTNVGDGASNRVC